MARQRQDEHNTQCNVVRRARSCSVVGTGYDETASTGFPPSFEQDSKVLLETGSIQRGTVLVLDW